MAKEIQIKKYQCNICKKIYDSEQRALKCESKPISQDKGVQIGDIVVIKNGDGAGEKAKVTEVYIIDMEWGHYAWDRYWHTVALCADIIGKYGSRQLTYDNYAVIGKG